MNYNETLEHLEFLLKNYHGELSPYSENVGNFKNELDRGNIPGAMLEFRKWIGVVERVDPEQAAALRDLVNQIVSHNPIQYVLIQSKTELEIVFDDLIECCKKMIRRTGSHGQTCESLIKQIIGYLNTDSGYLLVGVDKSGKMVGFLFAVQAYDWVEVIALYTKPGVGSQLKWEVFDLLKQWARSKGAIKIITCLFRSPEKFYEFFHKSLGFEKVGLILEVKI